MPDETAPDETSSTRWPSACSSQISATRPATGDSRNVPRSLVSVLEPILTTTVLPERLPVKRLSLLKLEGVAFYVHVVPRLGALRP